LTVSRIEEVIRLVAEDSMQRIALEEIKRSSNPEKCEISVSEDGLWKTRGHMLCHGIVSVIEAEIEK
jgi:hypothetical protein